MDVWHRRGNSPPKWEWYSVFDFETHPTLICEWVINWWLLGRLPHRSWIGQFLTRLGFPVMLGPWLASSTINDLEMIASHKMMLYDPRYKHLLLCEEEFQRDPANCQPKMTVIFYSTSNGTNVFHGFPRNRIQCNRRTGLTIAIARQPGSN